MARTFTALYVHFIFSTKDRLPQITPQIQPRLYQYLGGLCRERKSPLLAAGGIADHIHLLVSMSKEIAPAPFMRDIKANSSKWVHEAFNTRDFEWQAGYGGFSVSHSNLDQVKRYLASQEQHHRRRTFKDELIELLKLHDLPFEERFLW